MSGIKESKELLAGIKLLGVSAKKIAADGKVNTADLPAALELITNAKVLVDAIDNAEIIWKEEGKDLDQAELIELGAAVYDVIKSIKEAK